jgi:hypothetical protein
MIEISERITRATMSSDSLPRSWPLGAAQSQFAADGRPPTGTRVTLEFSRLAPLPPGEAVRVRYDFAGNGQLVDCVGVAQRTHVVARHGQLVAFHYRMSHWISGSTPSGFREVHA